MKTLVNKNKPAIRITAPEIESYREFYTLSNKDFHYLFKMEDWTLIEEEPVDLEKAAEEYTLSLSKSSMGGKEYCKQDFKAGAEWQKKQDEDGKALLYVNDHAYKKGFKDGKIEAMLNNELIWQDVKQIVNIADKEIEGLYRPFDKFPTEQSYYKEILKKYKEQKNK